MNKEKDIIDRVLEFCSEQGYSQSEFAKHLGMEQRTVNNYLNRSRKVSFEFIDKTISTFGLNANWLFSGETDWYKNKPVVELISNPKIQEVTSDQEVVLYDINAAANLKTLLGDKDQNIIGKISIPDIPKCDGAVYVKGDSMYPLLKSGDIIAYKEIHNLDYVVKGEMYLISFEMDGDEYLTVKYVNKSDKEDCIKLVSYNPHHDPMDIHKSCINAMALVKFSIRMNTMR